MQNYKGSLTYEDYIILIKNNYIISDNINNNQVQPSSIDLTLSDECYEISASFLSTGNNVIKNLSKVLIKKINLSSGYIFKKNKTYLVRINEKLNLNEDIFGMCNPKSSTGRLDVFCRTIINFGTEYEKIPLNYKGEIFIEITSRSFDVKFQKGDSLNQMRLIFKKNVLVEDEELIKIHKTKFLTLDMNGHKISPDIANGLKISVDLKNDNLINGYTAKKNTPTLYFNKIKYHRTKDFWDPIKLKTNRILIEKNKFYILKSNEKIQIPKNMAGEMVPYDTSIGDFRVHYAGFFDPGFGYETGAYAVLELKTNEVSFLLEHGQSIARIKYEKLNKDTAKVYGSELNSNYQHQSLALSKHFV